MEKITIEQELCQVLDISMAFLKICDFLPFYLNFEDTRQPLIDLINCRSAEGLLSDIQRVRDLTIYIIKKYPKANDNSGCSDIK